AVRSKDGWAFESIGEPEQQKLILQLFDSFKKQIRVGHFQLPASLDSPQKGSAPSPTDASEEKEADDTTEEPSQDAQEKIPDASPEPTAPPTAAQNPANKAPASTLSPESKEGQP